MTSLSTEVSQMHEGEEAREAALLTGKAMAEIDAARRAKAWDREGRERWGRP